MIPCLTFSKPQKIGKIFLSFWGCGTVRDLLRFFFSIDLTYFKKNRRTYFLQIPHSGRTHGQKHRFKLLTVLYLCDPTLWHIMHSRGSEHHNPAKGVGFVGGNRLVRTLAPPSSPPTQSKELKRTCMDMT